MKNSLINFALVFGSVLVAALTVLACDRMVGVFTPNPILLTGLLYPPGAEVTYETTEFVVTAKINALGFRDVDVPLKSQRGLRVIAIGDSFTFGWGIALEDAWVKVLEANLRAKGHDLEILNLGIPGASPVRYSQIAEDSIPFLKPDVILVGMPQMGDLRQAAANRARPDGQAAQTQPHQVLRRLFPNLSALVLGERSQWINKRKLRDVIGKRWKRQSRKILSTMTDEQRARFRKLDPDVRKAFRQGLVNPKSLFYVLDVDDSIPKNDFHLELYKLREEIRLTGEWLAKIKTLADAHGAIVIGLSIPTMYFTSPITSERRASLGFPAMHWDFMTDVPDEATRLACKQAGMECVVVTEAFREKALEVSMFHTIDGHFNAIGNRTFAELLSPIFEEKLFGQQRSGS